jgi:hypothetical protein
MRQGKKPGTGQVMVQARGKELRQITIYHLPLLASKIKEEIAALYDESDREAQLSPTRLRQRFHLPIEL